MKKCDEKKGKETKRRPEPRLTGHRQLHGLDEDPGLLGPDPVHHHVALVSARVPDLGVADDQGAVSGPQLLHGDLHPALELLRLPPPRPRLLEHSVGQRGPLEVAGVRGPPAQAGPPAAGEDHLLPHHGGDGPEEGSGGRGGGAWKERGIEGGSRSSLV